MSFHAWRWHRGHWRLVGTAPTRTEAHALFSPLPIPPTASHYCTTSGGAPDYMPGERASHHTKEIADGDEAA